MSFNNDVAFNIKSNANNSIKVHFSKRKKGNFHYRKNFQSVICINIDILLKITLEFLVHFLIIQLPIIFN